MVFEGRDPGFIVGEEETFAFVYPAFAVLNASSLHQGEVQESSCLCYHCV